MFTNSTLKSGSLALLLATTTSQGIVVMLSDTEPPGAELETWISANFTNVTEIRHGNYADFSATASQDALLGTGPHAGNGRAEVFIIGRTLSSPAYQNVATGYNTLPIPVVSLTAYTARQDGNRLGWHASGATNGVPTAGAETTVTPAGAAILGVAPGTYDFYNSAGGTFNGLSGGTGAFGGGTILATIGTDTLAAYWAPGSAPGNTSIPGQPATFPGPRLLFNLDNDVPGGGSNDFAGFAPGNGGPVALRNAIDFATPLTAVPEPSSALLGFSTLGLLGLRRRR